MSSLGSGPVGAGSPWSRLAAALRPRPSRAQLLVAALCALLGFGLVAQVRATATTGLAALRESDLVGLLANVSERSARLQAESRELEATQARLRSQGGAAALAEAQRRATTLGILAGTLPARGPGIELTVNDPHGVVRYDVLLDALQELRDAGAEAMSLGSAPGPTVRVVASTALGDADHGGVTVDGTRLLPPYRLLVIGDPSTLTGALDIPGGVLEVLRQRGASGVVSQRKQVDITALRRLKAPQYARPAPEATPASGG